MENKYVGKGSNTWWTQQSTSPTTYTGPRLGRTNTAITQRAPRIQWQKLPVGGRLRNFVSEWKNCLPKRQWKSNRSPHPLLLQSPISRSQSDGSKRLILHLKALICMARVQNSRWKWHSIRAAMELCESASILDMMDAFFCVLQRLTLCLCAHLQVATGFFNSGSSRFDSKTAENFHQQCVSTSYSFSPGMLNSCPSLHVLLAAETPLSFLILFYVFFSRSPSIWFSISGSNFDTTTLTVTAVPERLQKLKLLTNLNKPDY